MPQSYVFFSKLQKSAFIFLVIRQARTLKHYLSHLMFHISNFKFNKPVLTENKSVRAENKTVLTENKPVRTTVRSGLEIMI